MKKTLTILFILISIISYSQITIKHEYYTIVYDTIHYVPKYSYYITTRNHIYNHNNSNRLNKFSKDPKCIYYQASDKDYKKSDFDRGHMSPAEDFGYSPVGEKECFYYTNIIPQNSKNNRGQWKALEDHVRSLALDNDSILIITGCYSFSFKKLNEIYVPDYLYKIIYIYKTNKTEVYVIPNKPIEHYESFTYNGKCIDRINIVDLINKLK